MWVIGVRGSPERVYVIPGCGRGGDQDRTLVVMRRRRRRRRRPPGWGGVGGGEPMKLDLQWTKTNCYTRHYAGNFDPRQMVVAK